MPRKFEEASEELIPLQNKLKKMPFKKSLGGKNSQNKVQVTIASSTIPIPKECTNTTKTKEAKGQ